MKKILFGISMFVLFFFAISLSGCGEKACEHVEEVIAGKAATCTETGLTDGKKCSVCQEILVAQEEIAALGHTEEVVEGKAATCTEPGLTNGKKCSVCGVTTVAQEEIEALGHEEETVEGKAATCTEDGIVSHTHCSVCDKNFDAEGNELATVVIEALEHEYESTTTATCTADGVTTYTCSCGDTYTEETEKLGHIDENLDIDCDREGCTGKVAPKADSTLSSFTANCLGSKLSVDNKYYVEGTIVEVLDAKNGVFYLDDGTGEKFYFRLPKNAEEVSHANWKVKLVLGDKVRVYGKINKYSSSAAPNGQYYPAIQGGVVTLIEQHPHEFGEPTCVEPGYCLCGQDGPVALGHSDGDGDTLCDRCNFDVTLTIEGVEVRTDNNSGVTDAAQNSTTWSGTSFDVIVAKGTSSQLYSTSKDHMRIYKGNTLTISNKTGNTVKSIILHVTNATQLTNLEKLLAGKTFTKNEEEFTITVEWNSAENLVLTNNVGTLQLKEVEITYKTA